MPTTSNFGWTTPADTDLVKDGAAAIRTLGNGIDTSLVDLKGGTTGQVLSKASNTDLDYTWVTTDDANAIQNAIVDAKGDLIAASAADTPARLAVGNNNQVLTADSAEATGLKYANGSRATLTTTGDILYASAANTPARLGIGTAGQVLKVNSGATAPEWGSAFGTWATYTPVLTASTTNPTLGSGSTAAGRYVQNGKVVTAVVFFNFGGSGFAAGSGNLRVSLPVNATSYTQSYGMGSGAFIDVSGANGYILLPQVEATTYCTFRVQAGAYGEFTATNPVTLGQNDQLHLFFTYEVA